MTKVKNNHTGDIGVSVRGEDGNVSTLTIGAGKTAEFDGKLVETPMVKARVADKRLVVNDGDDSETDADAKAKADADAKAKAEAEAKAKAAASSQPAATTKETK